MYNMYPQTIHMNYTLKEVFQLSRAVVFPSDTGIQAHRGWGMICFSLVWIRLTTKHICTQKHTYANHKLMLNQLWFVVLFARNCGFVGVRNTMRNEFVNILVQDPRPSYNNLLQFASFVKSSCRANSWHSKTSCMQNNTHHTHGGKAFPSILRLLLQFDLLQQFQDMGILAGEQMVAVISFGGVTWASWAIESILTYNTYVCDIFHRYIHTYIASGVC